VNVGLASLLICAAGYGALAFVVASRSKRRAAALGLSAACGATCVWALAVALGVGAATGPLDVLRLLSWVAMLALASRTSRNDEEAPERSRLLVLGSALLGLVLLGLSFVPYSSGPLLVASASLHLAVLLGGLLMVESLLNQAQVEELWRPRFLSMGIGTILGFEVLLWSDTLLFHRIAPVLETSRSAVAIIAAPLIAIAAARDAEWAADLKVARRAILHGTILLAVGAYLLVLGAIGIALRTQGGDWGNLLQVTFISGGVMLLAFTAFSPAARSRVRLGLGRYLFTMRHDYREHWQRFADALASPSGEASLSTRALRALAEIVGSAHGGLWLREAGGFVCVADRGLPQAHEIDAGGDRFSRELEQLGTGVLELGDVHEARGPRRATWLPNWLAGWEDAWVLLPLSLHARLIGFAVLTRPAGQRAVDPEDEELLRTGAQVVASYLASEQSARKLEESRRFEELSRGLAFIAHDLRNLANELTLTLANARRHLRNPDFHDDLLLSMGDTVAGMQRLLDKLAKRKPEPPPVTATDFAQLVSSSWRGRASEAPSVRLELEAEMPLIVACDRDQLGSMAGHLVQNAIEAAGESGGVTLRLYSDGDHAVFEIADDGPGMTPEFLNERLYHPFHSSKPGGFGLGLYECRELARQAGGSLTVESTPGRGTLARLRLPLAPLPSESPSAEDGDAQG
jgi:putative PEP-CTERM system histidine kinase